MMSLNVEVAILVCLLSICSAYASGFVVSLEAIFAGVVVSLLSYLAKKASDIFWWIEALHMSQEESRGKLSHLEMRTMYSNLAGHELVRQLRTWFEVYDSSISPLRWFMSKLQG